MAEEILRKEKGHTTEIEAEIEMTDKNKVEEGNIQDLEVGEDLPLETKVKKGGVINAENKDIL